MEELNPKQGMFAGRPLRAVNPKTFPRESELEKLLSFIDSMPKEPANEDLEKEINRFFNEWQNVLCDEDCCNEGGFCCVLNEELKPVSLLHCREIAKHFANWQKKQLMKSGVKGVVHHFGDDEIASIHYDDPKGIPMSYFVSSEDLKAGDNVKLITIKEG